jgi:hypothetical protein
LKKAYNAFYPKLSKNVLPVAVYRMNANKKFISDNGVALFFQNELEHLHLSSR